MATKTTVSREVKQLTALGRELMLKRLDFNNGNGLSLQELMVKSGVTSLTISKLERGRLENISLETLNKISSALGVEIQLTIKT